MVVGGARTSRLVFAVPEEGGLAGADLVVFSAETDWAGGEGECLRF